MEDQINLPVTVIILKVLCLMLVFSTVIFTLIISSFYVMHLLTEVKGRQTTLNIYLVLLSLSYLCMTIFIGLNVYKHFPERFSWTRALLALPAMLFGNIALSGILSKVFGEHKTTDS